MSYNIDINTGHLRDFNLPAMSYIHVWIIFLSVHLNEQTFTTELNRSEGCQVWITKHEHFGAFKIDMIIFILLMNIKTYLVSSDIQQLMQLCGWNNGPPMKIKTSQD